MITLGIETSCDDTSICLLESDDQGNEPNVLCLQSFSQEVILREWGGVVPEIAARNHLEKLTPLIRFVFEKANLKVENLSSIGVTTHPGLLGPLLTGLNSAKTLALMAETSIVPVNHLYAHLEAIHLTEAVHYPYLGLIISGGHTLLLKVSSATDFKILGSTIDDAAGEAFDKGGKLLGLNYPAGREIDELGKDGDPEKYQFPIGLRNSNNGNFSFSGLKTSLKTWIENNGTKESIEVQVLKDVCASYQEAIAKALALKTSVILKDHSLPIVVGGGVACNSRVRSLFKESFNEVHFVKPLYCTDNGAMVANYAARTFQKNSIKFPECLSIDARGRFIDKNAIQKAPTF